MDDLKPYLIRYVDYTLDTVFLNDENLRKLSIELIGSNTQVLSFREEPKFLLSQRKLFAE